MSEKKKATTTSVDAEKAIQRTYATKQMTNAPLTIESLFQAGVYFGHKRSRRNPKMDEYVYTYRQNVAIIDLKKTLSSLEEALRFLEGVTAQGKQVLFVGTKKHVRGITKEVADRTQMPYVHNRWLGGTFTNFDAIRGRVRYLIDLEDRLARDGFSGYTKLEKLKKKEETEKMEEKLGGLRVMDTLPGALFVLDVKEDDLAIREAKRAGIPVIALVDTNDDPVNVSLIIPANNDAISSVRLIMEHVAQAIERGVSSRKAKQAEETKKE